MSIDLAKPQFVDDRRTVSTGHRRGCTQRVPHGRSDLHVWAGMHTSLPGQSLFRRGSWKLLKQISQAEGARVSLFTDWGLFSNMDLSMQHTTNVLEWLHRQFRFSAAWGHYVYPAGYMAVVFAESSGFPSTVSARGNDIDRLMFPPRRLCAIDVDSRPSRGR